ncbi:MAG: amino acid carrier protein [Eubacteriales bacterium]|nr:amino acid carrier protein [Eubacteriales bacterium]
MPLQDIIEIIVYDYMWGTPLIIIILLSGLYLTIKTGFFQFTHFGVAIKKSLANLLGKGDKKGKEGDSGVVSALEAVSIAIGTTVGVGNIGGVASAIALGGPGAVFWMWVSGLIGMIIKMVEITLALHYRDKSEGGENFGGPNYYISRGLGKENNKKLLSKILSALFTFGFIIGLFINIQTYTASEAIASTFNFDILPVAIFYTIALYLLIGGGIKRIGKVAVYMVPFMCLFYLAGGIFIIFKNIDQLPATFRMIFADAFTGTAALGGFAGASFKLAITTGMARSVFSNEAGWGSSPMTHASARVNHPVKQGLLGIFEVFVDTVIICTITATIIIITGQWSSGLDGADLTLSAFQTGMGDIGRIILSVGVFLFALTTSTGLFIQIGVVLRYMLGDSPLKHKLMEFYKWFYPIPSLGLVVIAVVYEMPGSAVWLLSDSATALPIFANIITLILLVPKFLELLNDYKARYLGKGQVNKNFQVFYEGSNEENQVDSH